jgi:predicted glycogen debranching enzyme
MTALPGLCLVTGRFEDAKDILRTFAGSVKGDTTLATRLSGVPSYRTVDAVLWFVVTTYKYLQYTRNEVFVREELFPAIQAVVSGFERGDRYRFHVDDDGLLYAGGPGVRLSWMDAKLGERIVTLGKGKAVEVNALWYNALRICAELAERFMYTNVAKDFEAKADRVFHRFNDVFWDDAGSRLFDYVDGAYRDPALRPYQIFAISLPFALVEGGRAWRMLQTIERHLYTPFGLRTLSPDDPSYNPTAARSQLDIGKHQGTVLAWLLGPYASALVRVEGSEGRQRAREALRRVIPHLSTMGLGTISEAFDGDDPHLPRGCIASASAVAEVVRAYVEDVMMRLPTASRPLIAVN